MNNLEEKYIMLLLNKCINFNKSKSLLISYDRINRDFILKVVEYANRMGIKDIYLDENDIFITHEKLVSLSLDEIEKDLYFNKPKWDEYALKDASFLIFDTEFPGVMDDIDSKKIVKADSIVTSSKGLFLSKQIAIQIPWCFAVLPNQFWARKLFPNDENAYDKLLDYIYRICLINDGDPLLNWDKYIKSSKNKVDELNSLGIKKLHFMNYLGTDLEVELTNESLWCGICDDNDEQIIVNMPSYEVYTIPNYWKTNGIVYSTMPLVYNGSLISDFYLVFKGGEVVEFNAKVGKNLLEEIINTDKQSKYLGEVALVEQSSPIAKLEMVFGTTLLDENASCHLALGAGYLECLKDFKTKDKTDLLNLGANQSYVHEDFMIGSNDMQIEAQTSYGKKLIMKNGNFC